MKNPCIGCPNNRTALRDACTICDARVAWVKFNAKDDFDATKEKIDMPDPTPETKICSACNQPRPLSEFRKHSQSPDGRVKTCNACRKPTPGRKPKTGSVPNIPSPTKVVFKKKPAGISVTPAEHYQTLHAVLMEAYDQASQGKGYQRHSDGQPFDEQDIVTEAIRLGIAAPVFQARKKLKEALRLFEKVGPEAAAPDLLGAINYSAATLIAMRKKGGTFHERTDEDTFKRHSAGSGGR